MASDTAQPHGGTDHSTVIDETCAGRGHASRALPRPRKKPRNVLPESPMKIRAGGLLNHRKPVSAEISARYGITAEITAFPGVICRNAAPRNPAAIRETPADSASMLSSIFKAFIMATIQNTI